MATVPELPYPTELVEEGVEGAVMLEARVEADGSLTDLQAVSSGSSELESAALQSVSSADWTPARIRGMAVAAPISVTVRFRLPAAEQ
jgi:TonB family protein